MKDLLHFTPHWTRPVSKTEKIYHNDWMLHTPFPYLSPSILCWILSKEYLSFITLWSTTSFSYTWLHELSYSLWPIRLAAMDKKITVVITFGYENFQFDIKVPCDQNWNWWSIPLSLDKTNSNICTNSQFNLIIL